MGFQPTKPFPGPWFGWASPIKFDQVCRISMLQVFWISGIRGPVGKELRKATSLRRSLPTEATSYCSATAHWRRWSRRNVAREKKQLSSLKKRSSFLLSAFWDVEQPDVAKCTINNYSREFIEWCNMSCRDFILVAMNDHTDFKIFFLKPRLTQIYKYWFCPKTFIQTASLQASGWSSSRWDNCQRCGRCQSVLAETVGRCEKWQKKRGPGCGCLVFFF